MDLAGFREYCLTRPGANEETPFGPDNLVFKAGGKIFALASLEAVPPRASLKCDPERALDLRDRYESVQPGYHMNKRHWNTVEFTGEVPDAELRRMIDDSYALVAQRLPKKRPAQLTPGRGSGVNDRPQLHSPDVELQRSAGDLEKRVRWIG